MAPPRQPRGHHRPLNVAGVSGRQAGSSWQRRPRRDLPRLGAQFGTVALFGQPIGPSHGLAGRSDRWRHLQEVVLVGAVGLGRSVNDLDGRPGFPAPALAPQDAGFVLRYPIGAALGDKALWRQNIDHAAPDLGIMIGGDAAHVNAFGPLDDPRRYQNTLPSMDRPAVAKAQRRAIGGMQPAVGI